MAAIEEHATSVIVAAICRYIVVLHRRLRSLIVSVAMVLIITALVLAHDRDGGTLRNVEIATNRTLALVFVQHICRFFHPRVLLFENL